MITPLRRRLVTTAWLALALATPLAQAQTCQTSADMDAATRAALTTTGQRYFGMVAQGDTVNLKQNAIPSLAGDFSGIEATVKEHTADLSESTPAARPPFVLDANGAAPIAHSEFFCGVFGKNGQTSTSAVFYLNNLPPGKYAVVILDATSTKAPTTVSFILQSVGSEWKVGGLYIKGTQIAGHDSAWFQARAREYKTKGQLHNAWLYYELASSLIAPLPFMSTAVTDKLYDESKGTQQADMPADGKTADLAAGSATFKLVALVPQPVGNDLDLIVRYQANDISNTNQTYQTNVAVMKALLAKYPELRDAFAGIVARAVDPAGRDYGTLLAMKDVK